jgi:hypothetical protein
MDRIISATLRTTSNSRRVLLYAILLSASMKVETAAAGAHCFCKLGPVSSPIHDFGEIASYNFQNGHDAGCKALCNDRSNHYMAANQASACNAVHGAAIVVNFAVGTKSYQGGQTYTCPHTSSTPTPGGIIFYTTPAAGRSLDVNGVSINLNNPPQQNVSIQNSGAFVTFTLNDFVQPHVQPWTYEAKLYRDKGLVENISKKAPGYIRGSGSVLVTFTGQPNSFVHGHDWKIEWHYFGQSFTNGSVSFHIQ